MEANDTTVVVSGGRGRRIINMNFATCTVGMGVKIGATAGGTTAVPLLVEKCFSIAISILQTGGCFDFSSRSAIFMPPPLAFVITFPSEVPSSVDLLMDGSGVRQHYGSS